MAAFPVLASLWLAGSLEDRDMGGALLAMGCPMVGTVDSVDAIYIVKS